MALETRQRLYCDAALHDGAELTLDRDQSHYLINVLRYQTGQDVLIFNGVDGEFRASITVADRKKAQLSCHEQTHPQFSCFFSDKIYPCFFNGGKNQR